MIRIEQLTKTYPTRQAPLTILNEVNLELHPGDTVAITGPSGSGKSTLLHLLGTLDQPTSGRIVIDGVNPFELSARELARFRNRQIGFIFQDHHLLPQCSVLENVLIPAMVEPEPGTDWPARARELLDQVGLQARLDHRPAELSGGERQRVAVARALLRRPKLILADEPTGNLDPANALKLGDLLRTLPQSQGSTLVVVTHAHAFAKQFPRHYEMQAGKLIPVSHAPAEARA